MILRQIKISELTALINSAEYASWEQVPISKARAVSQSINPFALPDDIALIIALDDSGKQLLSYVGAFPSKQKKADNNRFAWNSCWWVKNGEGGEAGMKVFYTFLQTWNKKVAFSDMTEKTYKIISNLGFCVMMKRDGLVVNIRPGIHSRLKAINFSNRRIRYFTNLFLYSGISWLFEIFELLVYNGIRKMRTTDSNRFNPLKIIDPEKTDFEFINENSRGNFYIPEIEALKMQPWLITPDDMNAEVRNKYYFSAVAGEFSTFWLRWEQKGETNALMMLSLRDGVLKTLFTYCTDDFKTKLPVAFVNYCFSNPQIRTLITSQPEITHYFSERKFFILSRRYFTKYSAISKELLKNSSDVPVFQDGDGDYRFT